MRTELKALCIVLLLLHITIGLASQSVDFSVSPRTLKPGETGYVRATLQIPADRKQSVNPNDPEYFYLEAQHPDLTFGKLVMPKATKVVSDTEWQYYPKVTLSLPFKVKDTAKPGEKVLNALMSYNLCYDSGMCDPPEEAESKISFVIASPEELSPETPDEALAATTEEDTTLMEIAPTEVETTPTATPDDETPAPWTDVLKYLLFAFLGGIILNITPCVLPILPIRIMSIMNQAQKDRSKVLSHTLVYALGVLISFAVMGGIFVGLQAAGQSAGWGTQNQNPYFVITLMAIVFVFALSLLGVFEITAPGMNTASKATSKGGYSGSFFGGIFAFLMAISCTGPFLGAALPFAMRLSPSLIMVFFMMIGLGFAFPFILIGLVPKALKIIPKPGDWMILFKELMGFVLLYLVFTMLKTVLQLTSGEYFLSVIFFMMILGFAIWLYGRFVRMEHSKATQWIFTIIALSLIIGSAYLYLPYKETPAETVSLEAGAMIPAPHAPEGWYVFSPELHAKLLAEGKSVFLDVGAAWCKNCLTNEKTVLFTKDIMADFAAKEVVLLKGDFTKKDPVLLQWIKDHERLGVPFNALYIPGEEPLLFPELITKNMIREALERIPTPAGE